MALQAVKLNAKPQPFYDNILKAIDNYTGGTPQAEDLTLMVVARR
jgi:serine phosphatase RsbU (regulator of sigma subunit)